MNFFVSWSEEGHLYFWTHFTTMFLQFWKQCLQWIFQVTVTNLNLITKYHCYCICLSGHLTLLGWLFNKLLTFTVLVQQTKHIGFPIMPRKTITDSGYKFLQIGQKTCSEEQFLFWFQIFTLNLFSYYLQNIKFLRNFNFHIIIYRLVNRPKVHQE